MFGTGCRHGMLSIERFLWFQLCSLEPRMACGSLERTPTKPLKLFNSGESFVYKCLYRKICSFIMIYIWNINIDTCMQIYIGVSSSVLLLSDSEQIIKKPLVGKFLSYSQWICCKEESKQMYSLLEQLDLLLWKRCSAFCRWNISIKKLCHVWGFLLVIH